MLVCNDDWRDGHISMVASLHSTGSVPPSRCIRQIALWRITPPGHVSRYA